ncbi:uncharacterized protein [Haliotis asinina]|uniref:uncharacterized protein n=1 Tax=Haliotis asinina TaxID=109174 RepID=UPI0035319B19
MAANINLLAAVEDNDDLLLLSALKEDDLLPERYINLHELTNDQCRKWFRFTREDLFTLKATLLLPDEFHCSNRTTCPGIDGLCILLRRLSYPNRLEDLKHFFGRSTSELSHIFNTVLNYIYDMHNHLLDNLDKPWLSHDHLEDMSRSIHYQGSPLTNCWGFIDGTVRPICRPQQNQKLVFNGHKRVHGLKYQSIVTPNGMIAHLYGPIEGRRHDAGMLRESDVEKDMSENMTFRNNVFCVYGDPAYPVSPYIIAPYRGGVMTANQALFNKKMSAVRICVEWTFGKLLTLFAFLDFKKNQKLYLQPVGKYYKVAAILTNCHTCLYGSETSSFFQLDPPSIQEYIHN